jgi:hypothetical protein
MANDKDFIVKNAVEVGGATKVTLGDAASAGSYVDSYNISSLSYDSKSADVSSEIAYAAGVAFKTDGTKMYVTSASSTGAGDVFQYSLSTAWDISTASYDSVSYSNGNISFGYGLQFKSDGTRLYIQAYEDDRVYEHTLSTAWDLSTTSATGNSLYYGSQTGTSYDFTISSDGTKIYVSDNDSPMYQYTMSTAWDISTASYDSVSFAVSGQTPDDGWYVQFNSDGTKMFGVNADDIYQYSLSTAWDLSTASYDNVSSIGGLSAITDTNNFVFKTDGTKLYQSRLGNVYQYTFGSTVTTGSFDLSTGNYFIDTPSADVEYTFSNAGDVQSFQLEVTGNNLGFDLSAAAYDSKTFSFSSNDATPRQIYIRDNGLDMYMVGSGGDSVYQYSLSTAWDISTASYATQFSVSSQETNPSGISFKTDGTKMYISGATGDDINQYSLSTAWDVSTASFDNVTAGSGEDTAVAGIFFKYDGTKFYMMGQSGTDINEFDMTTAWDISTASFNQKSSSISSYESAPWNLYFSTDGTKVFVIGTTGDEVNEFSLSTAWDISTLSHVRVFSVSSQDSTPTGIFFKDDGTKMYITGYATDAVYQYSTSSAITITWDADIQWAGGTAPDSPDAGEKDIYTITTDDGGTTYIGVQSGDAFS